MQTMRCGGKMWVGHGDGEGVFHSIHSTSHWIIPMVQSTWWCQSTTDKMQTSLLRPTWLFCQPEYEIENQFYITQSVTEPPAGVSWSFWAAGGLLQHWRPSYLQNSITRNPDCEAVPSSVTNKLIISLDAYFPLQNTALWIIFNIHWTFLM